MTILGKVFTVLGALFLVAGLVEFRTSIEKLRKYGSHSGQQPGARAMGYVVMVALCALVVWIWGGI